MQFHLHCLLINALKEAIAKFTINSKSGSDNFLRDIRVQEF